MVDRFRRHDILTYGSAVAFQLLVALVPLTLLALLLLGDLGLESVWEDQLEPGIQGRFPYEISFAITTTAERIINSGRAVWLLAAIALVVWEVSGSVRAIMGALNRINDAEETRPIWKRFALSFVLAVLSATSILLAMLVTTFGPRVADDVLPRALVDVLRWIVALALLWLAVLVLTRFAPAAAPTAGWISLGSAFVIVAWVLVSLGFRWYATHVASFETAFGTVTSFIVLASYVYASAIVFLTGAQIDQLLAEGAESDHPLRKLAAEGNRGR